MTFARLLTICTAACLGTMATADPDRLPQPRLTAISLAYDGVLSDPERNVDAISPRRMAAINSAFATHDPRPNVDSLSPRMWVMMQAAYDTHTPKSDFVGN